MFERYTEKARRVIFFARYEASNFGSTTIDAEHLLLGLLRENKELSRWLPKTDMATIRRRIEEQAEKRGKTSTSVDLPLNIAARSILKQAANEAERLASQHIGPEHLFLGLLEEKNCLAQKLLIEGGADAAAIRQHYAAMPQQSEPRAFQRGSYPNFGFRALSGETVEIHAQRWNVDYIRDVINLVRSHNWHWEKADWKPRDIVKNRKNGKLSFNLSLASDSANFELVKLGWTRDYCFVCRWELFESEDEHGKGYTNGHDWMCLECCERFLQRPDFFASSQSEIT
jgi:ATP-dependent Clp protease ATP-binding subunit ClpA